MKKLLYLLMGGHLAFVAAVNLHASYNLWRTARQPTATEVPLPRLLDSPAAHYYGRLTGAEHGYGFFGLNVRSNGTLLADYQALVLRNVALTLHQQAGRPDTALTLHYNILAFPTLAAVRRGQAGVYTQWPLLTAHYTFRHDER